MAPRALFEKGETMKKKKWNLAELIVPVFSIAFAAYYLYTIRGIAPMAQYYGGALSVMIIALSIVLIVIGIRHGALKISNPVTYFKEHRDDPAVRKYLKATLLMVMVAVYIALVQLVGYVIASILFMCGVMIYLGRKRTVRSILLPALLVTAIGFGLFMLFLNVSMPLDPASTWLKDTLRSLF